MQWQLDGIPRCAPAETQRPVQFEITPSTREALEAWIKSAALLAVPDIRRIAVLKDPSTGPWQLAAIKRAAAKLLIELAVVEIGSAGELDDALQVGIEDETQLLSSCRRRSLVTPRSPHDLQI